MKKVPWLIGAAAVVTLAACAHTGTSDDSGAGGKDTFVFAARGGTNQDAIDKACVQPFAKEHGLKVVEDTSRSLAKLKLMVNSKKVTWNVVYNAVPDPAAGDQSKLLEPLDYSIIDTKQIFPGYAEKYGVAHDLYSDVIAYNTKVLGKNGPTTWADFLNAAKYPGKIGIASVAYNGPINLTEMAASAYSGVKNHYPIDTSRVTKVLGAARHDFVYYSSAAQSQQLLTSGRVAMEGMVASQAYELMATGQPIAVEWNQNLSAPDWMEVPKGAPNKKLDMEFINYCLQKAPQLAYSKIHPNGPINVEAAKSLPPELAAQVPSSPDHIKKAFPVDQKYWTDPRTSKSTSDLQGLEIG